MGPADTSVRVRIDFLSVGGHPKPEAPRKQAHDIVNRMRFPLQPTLDGDPAAGESKSLGPKDPTWPDGVHGEREKKRVPAFPRPGTRSRRPSSLRQAGDIDSDVGGPGRLLCCRRRQEAAENRRGYGGGEAGVMPVALLARRRFVCLAHIAPSAPPRSTPHLPQLHPKAEKSAASLRRGTQTCAALAHPAP